MSSKETVLVVVAHSDDQILGAGGAVAKYVEEGKKIITVIFSYGELSHFYFKREIIAKMRVKESQDADKIIGGDGVIFFGVKEGKFKDDFKKRNLKSRMQEIIMKHRPEKIITHGRSDSHPDHRAVHDLLLDAYDDLAKRDLFKTDVYVFALYGIKFKVDKEPRMVIDISKKYFRKKLKALGAFKSQHTTPLWWLWLKWAVYYKAFISGMKHSVRFAEEFYKVR